MNFEILDDNTGLIISDEIDIYKFANELTSKDSSFKNYTVEIEDGITIVSFETTNNNTVKIAFIDDLRTVVAGREELIQILKEKSISKLRGLKEEFVNELKGERRDFDFEMKNETEEGIITDEDKKQEIVLFNENIMFS